METAEGISDRGLKTTATWRVHRRAVGAAGLAYLLLFATVPCLRAQSSDFEQLLRALPNTGRAWSILENQSDWTVTQPLDTGGMETGALPYFGVLGASWTENRYLLNGFDITDPYVPGRPLLDPHLSALSTLEVATSAKPAEQTGSGADVLQISGHPNPAFHATAEVLFSGSSLQNRAQLAEPMNHLVDASFCATGRLGIPVFVSGFAQDLSKDFDASSTPLDGRNYGVLASATAYSSGNTRFEILYSGQHLLSTETGAEVFTNPIAATQRTMDTHAFQIRGSNGRLQTGFGVLRAHVSSALRPGAGDSILDLPERSLHGSAPVSSDGTRMRIEAFAEAQKTFGPHDLRVGAGFQWNSVGNRWTGHDQSILVDGIEALLLQWNAAGETSARLQDFGAFLWDEWKATSWLAVPLGVRIGMSRGAGISWTSLEPRFQARARLKGTLLRAGWSRYAHLLEGRYLDFASATAPGGVFLRGDTVVSRFGAPYSAIAPDLKQPTTSEIFLAAEQHLSGSWSIGLQLFHRKDSNLIGLENTGVPFSTYSAVMFDDPGNDGIPGTSDDQVLTLYNRDPSTFGQDDFLLTNPAFLSNRCKGFQLTVRKALKDHWSVAASFAGLKSSGTTNPGNSVLHNDVGVIGTLGTDPNTLLLADSTTFFDRGFLGKVTAFRQWPFGFTAGVVGRYYDGLPFARMLFVPDLNQGPAFVRTTPRNNYPDGFRTQFNATLDVRLSQRFRHWTAILDVFNLLNWSNKTREGDLTGPLFATRIPLQVQTPRTIRLGIRFSL